MVLAGARTVALAARHKLPVKGSFRWRRQQGASARIMKTGICEVAVFSLDRTFHDARVIRFSVPPFMYGEARVRFRARAWPVHGGMGKMEPRMLERS